jgi:glycosyltransferase involved in cell wall biosynthesis
MKFLLISPFTNASGSAIRFWNIALALQKKGHQVVYVDRKSSDCSQLFFSDSIKYHTCPSSGIQAIDIFCSLLFNFVILLKNLDSSVVYALKPAPNNCIPALFAKLLGKKVLLDVDDLDYAYLSGWKNHFFRIMFDFFSQRFAVVTYHTPNLKKYLHEKVGVPENKLHYLAQGVSTSFLDIDLDQLSPIKKSVIYVATLGITSDFGDLIPGLAIICKNHPDMTMDIVGDGCRKKEFEELIADLGLGNQIHFAGKFDHDRLPQFIARHQIGINYMRSLEVNRCRAILKIREYLACGLIVVCNDVGDVELFKEHIFIEKEIENIFLRLDNLLSSPLKRNYSGRKIIEEKYTWKDIIEEFDTKVFCGAIKAY